MSKSLPLPVMSSKKKRDLNVEMKGEWGEADLKKLKKVFKEGEESNDLGLVEAACQPRQEL